MQRRFKIVAFLLFAVAFCVSLINPVFPDEQLLQHTASLAALIIMIYLIKTNWISNLSFLLFTGFMMLHLIGARWIYTYVPYDQWSKVLFGISLNEWFGWHRNHFDRLVHFLYGLLLYMPIQETFVKKLKFNFSQSVFVAFAVILSSSLLYELFEWSITLFMSPYDADNYNGQQGDSWDSHKDMALAALGGMIMMVIKIINSRISNHFHRSHP
jgi:putative membrane protein